MMNTPITNKNSTSAAKGRSTCIAGCTGEPPKSQQPLSSHKKKPISSDRLRRKTVNVSPAKTKGQSAGALLRKVSKLDLRLLEDSSSRKISNLAHKALSNNPGNIRSYGKIKKNATKTEIEIDKMEKDLNRMKIRDGKSRKNFPFKFQGDLGQRSRFSGIRESLFNHLVPDTLKETLYGVNEIVDGDGEGSLPRLINVIEEKFTSLDVDGFNELVEEARVLVQEPIRVKNNVTEGYNSLKDKILGPFKEVIGFIEEIGMVPFFLFLSLLFLSLYYVTRKMMYLQICVCTLVGVLLFGGFSMKLLDLIKNIVSIFKGETVFQMDTDEVSDMLTALLTIFSSFSNLPFGSNSFSNYVWKLSKIKMSADVIGSVIKILLSFIQSLVNKVLQISGSKYILDMFGTGHNSIDDFNKRVHDLERSVSLGEFPFSMENFEALRSLLTLGEQLSLRLGSDRKYQSLSRLLDRKIRSLEHIIDQFSARGFVTSGLRQEPVSVLFRGKPGVGKSQLIHEVHATLCTLTLPEAWLPAFKENHERFLYNRQTEQEYWDGYDSFKWVTVFDDLGQRVDAVSNPNLEYMEIIRSVNQFSYLLHMASLDQKSNTYFKSKFVLATTNLAEFHPQSIIASSAFNRRFDLDIEISVKPEFVNNYVDEVPQLDLESLPKGQDGSPSFSAECLDFRVKSKEGSRPITYDEMIQIIIDRYNVKKSWYMDKLQKMKDRVNDAENLRPQEPHMEEETLAHSQGDLLVSETTIGIEDYYEEEVPYEDPPGGTSSRTPLEDIPVGGKPPFIYPIGEHGDDKLSDMYIQIILNMPDDDSQIFAQQLLLNTTRPIVYFLDALDIIVEEKCDETTKIAMACKLIYKLFHKYDKSFAEFMETLNRDFDAVVDMLFQEEKEEIELCPSLSKSASLFFRQTYHAITVQTRKLGVGIVRIVEYLTKVLGRPATSMIMFATSIGVFVMLHKALTWFFDKIIDTVKGFFYPKTKVKEEPVQSQADTADPDERLSQFLASYTSQSQMDNNHQDCCDSIIAHNTYAMHIERDTGEFKHSGFITFVQGNTALVNFHYITYMAAIVHEDRKNEDRKVKLIKSANNRNNRPLEYVVTLKDILKGVKVGKSIKLARERDFCLVSFPNKVIPPHRKIVNKFCTIERLEKIRDYNFKLIIPKVDKMFVGMGIAKPISQPIPVLDLDDTVRYVTKGFSYKVDTNVGDCGALFTVITKDASNGVIFGIHSSGNPSISMGFSTLVTREDILELLEDVPDVDKVIFEEDCPHDLAGPYTLGVTETQMDKVGLPERMIPVKTLDKPISINMVTRIKKSPFFDKWFKAKTMPAMLRDSSIKDINPYRNSLTRYCYPNPVIDDTDLKIVSEAYLEYLISNSYMKHEPRILSFKDAVVGAIEDDTRLVVARDTSAGYPYSVEIKDKGKYAFFGRDQEFNFESKHCVALKERVDKIIHLAKRNERLEHIFTDFLKDERRPIEKAKTGMTRLVSGCPLDLLIAYKMYFGSFMIWFMENRIENGSGIGMNPFGSEWNSLARKIQAKCGNEEGVGAGDFSAFDGRETPKIHWAILDMINVWYDDDNSKIRRVLWYELINSHHVRENVVYSWFASLPSGHPLTSVINTMYNHIVFRLCWLDHKKPVFKTPWSSMRAFAEHVYLIAFGDDNVFAVTPAHRDFTEEVVSERMLKYGLVYTSESKGVVNKVLRTIHQVSFLKRTFRMCPINCRFIAPLNLEVILEMPMWTIEDALQEIEVVKTKFQTALDELSLHGKEIFNRWSQLMIREYVKHFDHHPLRHSYHNCLDFCLGQDNPFTH